MGGVFEVTGTAALQCAAGAVGGAAVGATAGFTLESVSYNIGIDSIGGANTVDGAFYGAVTGGAFCGGLPVWESILPDDGDEDWCPA